VGKIVYSLPVGGVLVNSIEVIGQVARSFEQMVLSALVFFEQAVVPSGQTFSRFGLVASWNDLPPWVPQKTLPKNSVWLTGFTAPIGKQGKLSWSS